jgi:hypothetical protein
LLAVRASCVSSHSITANCGGTKAARRKSHGESDANYQTERRAGLPGMVRVQM